MLTEDFFRQLVYVTNEMAPKFKENSRWKEIYLVLVKKQRPAPCGIFVPPLYYTHNKVRRREIKGVGMRPADMVLL